MKRTAVVLLSTILLLGVFVDIGNTARISGQCRPDQISFASSDDPEFVVRATEYRNLPEVTVIFTQGGTSPSCVIAVFSAEAFSPANVSILIRAVMDDVTQGLPNEVRLVGDSPIHYTTHTMTFIFPRVEPGRHVMRIQYLRSDVTDEPEIGVRNLLVHHTR